jgi:5-methylcytosine-specific restriction protein A
VAEPDRPAYHQWYSTYRWQRIRKQQILDHPLCAMCHPRVVAAKVCDHVEPHKGDEHKFWNGPFQSLCLSCHNSDKQRIEKGGKPKPRIGKDGWHE